MTEHEDPREAIESHSAAEVSLIKGDALVKRGNVRRALTSYGEGLSLLDDASSDRDLFAAALLHYSVGEVYRSTPWLAPDTSSALQHLLAADIDSAMGNPNLPMRGADRHGLAYLVQRAAGLIDLQRVTQSIGGEVYVTSARIQLGHAETELLRHVMATMTVGDSDDTLDMEAVRTKANLIDPDLLNAIDYADALPQIIAREAEGRPQPSMRARLFFLPTMPKYTKTHAKAAELLPH